MTLTLCDSRIELIPATLIQLRTELDGSTPIHTLLGLDEPPYWPPEGNDNDSVQFFAGLLDQDPENSGWGAYYLVDKSVGRHLAGSGGYLGKPDADGSVEIGYSILTPFRRKGLATALTRLLVEKAFADTRVNYVLAKTLPDFKPSIGVLEKLGFTQTGATDDYHTHRLTRP